MRQARSLEALGGTPLVVLTARGTVEEKASWGTTRGHLAELSTNVRHDVADLGHTALLDDPDGAALSAQAVTDVVNSVRTRTPLGTST